MRSMFCTARRIVSVIWVALLLTGAIVTLAVAQESTGFRAAPGSAMPDIGPPVLKGKDPKPEDAQKAIIALFDKYEVVGMPQGHGNKDVDDFILALIRNPAFPGKVSDIAVECGNSLYQPILDRYIAGEDVPLSDVQQTWRNTSQPSCGLSTLPEQLPALVRQINQRLPQDKKLRMLAGDPPIDWSKVKSGKDAMGSMGRDASIASVMEREVLSKHRNALMLFGTFHLYHGDSAVGRYEKDYPNVTYVIEAHNGFGMGSPLSKYNDQLEKRMASWPVPSLVTIKGTWLDELDFSYIMPSPIRGGVTQGGGMGPDPQGGRVGPGQQGTSPGREGAGQGQAPRGRIGLVPEGGRTGSTPPNLRFSERADGYLYLGPRDLLLYEHMPANTAMDTDYIAELQRRKAIMGGGSTPLDHSLEIEKANPALFVDALSRLRSLSGPGGPGGPRRLGSEPGGGPPSEPQKVVFAGPPDTQPDTNMAAAEKAEAVSSLAKALRDNYVFAEVGERIAKAIEEKRALGGYDSITSAGQFAEILTTQMYEIAHDKHLRIDYRASARSAGPPPAGGRGPDQRRAIARRLNYAIDEVKRLDGNIGYLKMTGFVSTVEDAGPTVASAMAFLANTDAMVIDLRQNSGGSPGMVQLLASYFFSGDQPVHLNDVAMRKPGTNEYNATQWWVLPNVPGQRYVDKEVYILTSHHTPSAAEEFTYDLQALKRATVVGETTWGGANPTGPQPIGEHFVASIPAGQAINPITHTNWDGVGIKPNIEAPAADALKAAQQTALEHLIAKATDERELGILKRARSILDGDTAEEKK